MTPQQRFNDNIGLVYHVANRYKCPAEDYEDMLQEGREALWKACLGFDETNGAQFSTYAGRAIELAYMGFTRKAWNSSGLSASRETLCTAYNAQREHGDDIPAKYRPLLRTALSTEYYAFREDDDGTTIADEIAHDDEYGVYTEDARRVLLAEIDSTLTGRKREMLMLRFGLNGGEPMTYREIGEVFDVSHEYVRQQVGQALALLRHPRHSSKLAELTH